MNNLYRAYIKLVTGETYEQAYTGVAAHAVMREIDNMLEKTGSLVIINELDEEDITSLYRSGIVSITVKQEKNEIAE